MTVQELRDELNRITNQNLEVVILSDDISFKSVTDIFEDELGFDNNENIKRCIRIK